MYTDLNTIKTSTLFTMIDAQATGLEPELTKAELSNTVKVIAALRLEIDSRIEDVIANLGVIPISSHP